MSEFIKVAAESELAPGQLRRVAVDGLDVVLANVDGTVYAFGAACTHDEGPLEEGELEAERGRFGAHLSAERARHQAELHELPRPYAETRPLDIAEVDLEGPRDGEVMVEIPFRCRND
jgi:hypothetical protein